MVLMPPGGRAVTFNRRGGVLHNLSDSIGEEKGFLPVPGIEPRLQGFV